MLLIYTNILKKDWRSVILFSTITFFYFLTFILSILVIFIKFSVEEYTHAIDQDYHRR